MRRSKAPCIAAALALAAGVTTATAGPATAALAPHPEPLVQPQAFKTPASDVRPQTRWWWGQFFGNGLPLGPMSVAETRREMREFAAAGFGSVEIAFGRANWATAEQRENLEAALDEADKLGMTVDMTIGANWPVTTPNTRAGSGLSQQELQYGRADVTGGTTFDGPAPAPYDDAANARGGRLFAVTAAKVLDAGPAVTRVNAPPTTSTVLDPSSLVDLTAEVDAGGNLTWEVPGEGSWIVFAFWQRDARQDVIDAFDAAPVAAAGRYVGEHQFTDGAAALLRKAGGSFFEDSLELRAEGLFWTHEMAARFEQRRGYGVRRLLPLFFQQGMNSFWVPEFEPVADFELPEQQGRRIRHDYYETLTDLYVDEHLQSFQDWADSRGVQYRSQAAFGQNLDTIRSARELARMGGLADTESYNAGDRQVNDLVGNRDRWRFAFDMHRNVSSGAHQGGSSEISSELGAQGGKAYSFNIGDYKTIMDKEWAAGTSRITLHGASYQGTTARWPGDTAFGEYVSDSWNASWPQWAHWKPMSDYWARGTTVLETGTPRTDVAIYRDGFVTIAATGQVEVPRAGLFDALALERAGYSLGYLDPNGVIDRDAEGDGVLFPRGPRYRAIVIDERALPAAVAERLAEEAEQGLAVVFVGELPNRDTSYKNATRGDIRVQRAIERLLDAPTVARAATQADAAGALQRLGVVPDARWSTPVQVYSQQRETKTADYYYLYNATSDEVTFDGSFASKGRPYALDLWNGDITPLAAFRQDGERTSIPLTLPPLGTTVLAIRKDEPVPARHIVSAPNDELVVTGEQTVELRDVAGGPREVRFSDGTSSSVNVPPLPAPLTPASWQLHIDGATATGTVPHDLELTELKPWVQIPGLERVAGVGTYTTTLDLPADWTAAERGALLQLGTVLGTVRIWVNGSEAGPGTVAAQRRWDVSALLKPGANELKVEVATALRNAVPSGFGPFVRFSERYGLLGPVQLIPYGRAAVDLKAPVVTPPVVRPPLPNPPVVRPPAARPPVTRRAAARAPTLRVTRSVRLARLTKRGLVAVVAVPARGKITFSLTHAKVRYATVTKTAGRAGSHRIVVKLGSRAKRRLATRTRGKAVTLTLTAKVTSGGRTRTLTSRIEVRR
ncbi:glycosyl hydrolase [Conexibacter stalactiti]|uniref:Glycosyl hydrolase n=1 Tax=Conexibacter stalactiti TaxID=1940611 RepID=A0ABU4HU58_9ACTN|nr:glycosyl hydrolase [Conexibacter stalactiti]MDW5596828.1 glycosyl hydrolase [Conexibacter stalactiti]MEC5037470.1 glycosyl hydrolase [Conexibacter stalactiti]